MNLTLHHLRVRPHGSALAATRLGLQTVGPLFVAVGVGAGVFMVGKLDLPLVAAAAPISIAVTGAVVTARGSRRCRFGVESRALQRAAQFGAEQGLWELPSIRS